LIGWLVATEQQNEEADYRRALEELQQLQAQQDTLPETIAKAKAILQETKQRYELIRQRMMSRTLCATRTPESGTDRFGCSTLGTRGDGA